MSDITEEKDMITIRLYHSPTGWRWTMTASNGRIKGASTQGYSRREAALRNIFSVVGISVWHFGSRGEATLRYEHLGTREYRRYSRAPK
jgi:uncharacterized protein YegP (UPF0339 family)